MSAPRKSFTPSPADRDPGGRLVLVATPIGNLGDIAPRAAETLATADLICCEDTRRSRQLLTHLGITGQRLVSLHEHNEAARIEMVTEQLDAGLVVALISDAGMPVVSDPGQRLVAAVAAAGHTVTAVPGPSAAIMALAISGLPAERFGFEGFLPTQAGPRRERLQALAAESRTSVLYESPHRLAKTLAGLVAACGPQRQIVITRELTKLHEEVWRGSLETATQHVTAVAPRGEYTLVLAGAPEVTASQPTDDAITELVQARLASGDTQRDAIAFAAGHLDVPRKRVYALALKL